MGENSKTPPGAKALVAAIDGRIEELRAHGDAMMREVQEYDTRLGALMKEMRAVGQEVSKLESLKRQYLGRPAKADAKGANDDHRPGATPAIFRLLQTARDHRLPMDNLVQRMEGAIKAGSVRTDTTDPRKLVSSVIGNLVRAGRLLREGDEVILPDEK